MAEDNRGAKVSMVLSLDRTNQTELNALNTNLLGIGDRTCTWLVSFFLVLKLFLLVFSDVSLPLQDMPVAPNI